MTIAVLDHGDRPMPQQCGERWGRRQNIVLKMKGGLKGRRKNTM